MGRNIFVTTSRVPPVRWKQAFPAADVVRQLPPGLGEGCLVWLHNMTPVQFLGEERPAGVRFIVVHDEPTDEAGLAALSQGAAGYCNAHATPELLHTVESVVRNHGLWVGESLLGRLLGGISARTGLAEKSPEEHPALASLSERERLVALAVARGESNKEIARQLNLAERTIKAHLTSIFDKFHVRDRLQLALFLGSKH